MALYDAVKESYEVAEVDGRVVLFTNARLDRDTVPEGLFCYDVRDSDNLDGSFAQIAPFVLVNHWGTILCREPFPLDEGGSYYPDDWGFLGESMGAVEFRQADREQLAIMQGEETSGQGISMGQ
ncbi:MAG: hypothetical protein HFH80_01430 [Lachnospiraceae bacterium]|nr:hypothetical protein [Lachnospiraceae bacterium]